MTAKLSEKLDLLDIKLRQYIQFNALIKQENTELHAQIQKLKANLASTNNKMLQLQRHLVEGRAELEQKEQNKEKQAKRLKKQLDQYINHIDESIGWLEQS
jgi:cell division septum initiation protein DivIVA